ncbi:MAG TPA: alpha/beta hydrolase [Solirubrobacteraceae bacterium]|nr:alpha/beta hydrolase [Solirubrobacteraceae bacterium]
MSTPQETARSWAHYTEPSTVDVDGLATAYRRAGDGPTTVYLHGGGLTRMWLPFYERLAQKLDLVAPEHPGFGDTPLPDHFLTFSDFVLHYDAFFDALDLDDVHLVAHSLGGWIGANLAVFYPRRFKSLTLVTPTGLRLPDVDSIDTFRMTPEEGALALLNGRAERYTEYFVQEGEPEDAIHAFSESATMARLTFNPRYDFRLDSRLARVTSPTLVIGAQDDRIVPTEMAGRFAEVIPGARLVTVEGPDGEASSHVPHLEQPDAVAALVTEHILANA